MGVSFKVSKTGIRFRPKPLAVQPETAFDEASDNPKESSENESSFRKVEGDIIKGTDASSISSQSFSEHDVSFTLNLYLDGYSIGKPSENESEHHGPLQDSQSLLHPYDRTSETLFSAIESGRLPGDLLDDIPCKYVNGSLMCEVRDYRKCASDQGSNIPSIVGLPIVHKVHLRMSLENIVKDIPSISDSSWTYGDLMEVESRILKALQPQLCLDPSPKLDRLCDNPLPTRLNLDMTGLRRKRMRQTPEATVTSNNRIHGKKVCIDRVPESSNSRFGDSGIISGNAMPQIVQENLAVQSLSPSSMLALRARSFTSDGNVSALPLISQQTRYTTGAGTPRSVQDHASGGLSNMSGASPSGQDSATVYGDNVNSGSPLHVKREHQDGQMSPLSNFNKRARLSSVGPDGNQPQHIGSHVDSLHASDINWKNSILQQAMARGIQYGNPGLQKYPSQMFEGLMSQNSGATSFSAGQPGMRIGPNEEQFEMEKLDSLELGQVKNDMQVMETETVHLDMHHPRPQQRLPPNLMRSNFAQGAWNNLSQDPRKEERLQKRKSAQSPRLSTGALAQSPLSSKSAELSSGSAGPHFGAIGASGGPGSSQKEKSAVCGTPSLTSSTNDSLQRQHQAQVPANRRSNSLPRTPVMSNVGSPASVSNISVPLNANSPSIGTPPMADQTILERFSKIEMVTMRHQLNRKKNKIDDWSVKKHKTYSPEKLSVCLSSLVNNEQFNDDSSARQLSKSLVGGNINTCKMRVMNFVRQGNQLDLGPKLRTTMIMSEKPNDGTVAMHYGDTEDCDILSSEDYLPTLPNTHSADLLAAQFCLLMMREGYHVEDHIQSRPLRMNIFPPGQSNPAGVPPSNPGMEVQQYNEAVSSHPSNDVKPTLPGNAAHNQLANSRAPPLGNPQANQMSQGLLSGLSVAARPQMDPQPSLQQPTQQQQQQQQQQQMQLQQMQQPSNQHSLIQQQQSQFQRSPMVLPSSSPSQLNAMGQNSSMQLGNHMVNKPAFQLQLLQQQQQQQQQQHQQPQLQQLQPPQPNQQQQPQMQQRKIMMGPGTAMGMGNVGNGLVGLGSLANTMGIGGARGIGGPGMSGSMTPISGISSVGQNPVNLGQISNITNAISQQLRNGQMTPAQAAALMQSKLKRASMLGAPQSGMVGMPGGRQMHAGSAGLSMLGQSLNRANMNPIQRTAMSPMGPPKLMAGVNLYMNQQQQHQQLQLQQPHLQHQQQHQQQLQQLQHQQLQQQQQQESTSSLQAVVSPSQVGSPSTMGIPQLNQLQQQQPPQNQPSSQQMNQRTPMSPQLSSGAIHAAMSAGNPDACPASPQQSSQTLGSVGSITNSPMELQGVNKSSSVNNA